MSRQLIYKTLVLVTDQFECERIIKAARTIADLSRTELIVLSVAKNGSQVNPAALEHLFGIAKEYRAGMIVQYSDNPQSVIVHFIRDNRVVNVITGLTENEQSILLQMWKKLRNIKFFTVSKSGKLSEVIHQNRLQTTAAHGCESAL
jgi:K+-sensing histidine kinase KdpD